MDEQNIPIDINTAKLLDWLISRRHVDKEWQTAILKIREKINIAIQDMPEREDIVNLLSGQHINYYHCLKIIDILKETEADSKNLFGRYGSQRMKDWKDIVQMYERNSVYLAEAAQILIRNTNFEITSLRKQLSKLEQVQSECEKKSKEYSKIEHSILNEFNTSCKQLGISGVNIKKELTALLNDLPEIYDSVEKKAKSLKPTVALYVAYLNYHSDGYSNRNVFPLLQYVIDKGNTTTYEYTYCEKPIDVEEPDTKIEADDEAADLPDFGDEIEVASEECGEIDWGTLSTDEGFEIVDHTDLDVTLCDADIVVEKSGNDGGIARGNDAFTVLDNPKTRDQFLNDLMELEAFLMLRLLEKSSDSDVLDVSQMQDAPAEFQMQTVDSLKSMLEGLRVVLSELTNKRTQHLHNIKHFSKYIDMLTESLRQKLASIDGLKDARKRLDEKIENSRLTAVNTLPTIERIIKNTKILQKQIEEEISKKYKGRPVHIVGSVNML